MRSALIGAVIGSFATLASMSFVACQKSDKKSSAKAQGGAELPAQSKEELGEIIAEVDGYQITVGDFQERINKQSPYIRARYTSMERKKEFLDNLIRFEVLAKEAKARGMDQDPEVVRTMKQVMIQKLMKEEFESRVKPEDVTEDEMKKFYEEHKAEYNKPEEVRVSAIVVGAKDKATADKVAAEAKGPKGADNKGFRDLVTQYSIHEESKTRGGDLRYFAADATDIPPEVVKAAFELAKTGDVAGPIKTATGYYIIKQTGRRKALSKSFDEVKRQIQNRIFRDKRTKAMEDFVAGLKAKAKIKINEDKLAKVRVDTTGAGATPGTTMPGMPSGQPMPGGGGLDPHEGMGIEPKPPSNP
jgi:peptidyl-prolyl cis-trans isomerase C